MDMLKYQYQRGKLCLIFSIFNIIDYIIIITVNPDNNQPSPQNIRASISPIMYNSFQPSMLMQ